jgi:hypothetical protein
LQWISVGSAIELIPWEKAWASLDDDAERPRTFRPDLLSRPEIHIIRALSGGVSVGGGILNAGAGMVGLSNLFASGIKREIVWDGLSKVARTVFPGLPLVAYDRGDDLAAAHRAGFTTIGPLRIWQRSAAI